MSHEWGNYPENIEPKMYWGARAIIENSKGVKDIVLLSSRQSFEQLDGSRMDKDDFICWINETVLPAIREKAKYRFFYRWEDTFIMDSDGGVFHCEATPKGSYGSYLYIGCWEVEMA